VNLGGERVRIARPAYAFERLVRDFAVVEHAFRQRPHFLFPLEHPLVPAIYERLGLPVAKAFAHVTEIATADIHLVMNSLDHDRSPDAALHARSVHDFMTKVTLHASLASIQPEQYRLLPLASMRE